jgi:PPOX class probable F420-dependent enzyme
MSKSQRDTFLSGRRVAVLVTIAPDGRPVPTPIWYLYRSGRFYFRTAGDAVKTKNVERDPRVSICVQDEQPPYRTVTVYGHAEVAPAMDWLASQMPRHYLGAVGGIGYQRWARTQIEQGPDVALVVMPERFTTSDFSGDTPLVGRIWLRAKRFLPPWL